MTSCKECVAHLLGACRGDFCEPERVSLAEMVRRIAEENGHLLTAFERESGRPTWHVACSRCGLEASYTLDPEPGTPAIVGAVLDTPCVAPRG
jgi:hypothetical protein